MEIDVQALVNQLSAQRNAAMDEAAKLGALLQQAHKRIEELEKCAATPSQDPSASS